MKFNFKIQEYQTDAVNSVVNCFKGQKYNDGISYRRDIGDINKIATESIKLDLDSVNLSIKDDFDETGFKNQNITLTNDELLSNIRNVQQLNNIMLSDSLIGDLGACTLDIEMETGERVIIVMGAICVIKSRVSGTFNKYNSCIA